MAGIQICDRVGCDSFGTTDAMGIVKIATDPSKNEQRFELCPGCVGDLIEQLATEPAEGTRKKSYQEPWKEPAEKKAMDDMSLEEATQLYARKLAEQTQKVLEM
jgi:hypothetical protein